MRSVCIYICNCGKSYIGEKARNFEVRRSEHLNISKQSEPARHLKENPTHNFEWELLTIVQHWLRRRVSEALYIAYHKPNLNKQVQSFELALFPKGIEIT